MKAITPEKQNVINALYSKYYDFKAEIRNKIGLVLSNAENNSIDVNRDEIGAVEKVITNDNGDDVAAVLQTVKLDKNNNIRTIYVDYDGNIFNEDIDAHDPLQMIDILFTLYKAVEFSK